MGSGYEVIWGELYGAPAPSLLHQFVVGNLFRLLDRFVREHRLGWVLIAPVDVVLSEHNVVQPDVLFVRRERASLLTEANVQGAPDLVVEVLSPATAAQDRGTKWDAYAAAGVAHYWLVDPRSHTLEAYALEGEDYRLAERRVEYETFVPALCPGLALSLNDLWQ